ncbi:endoplasmic reticulum aminopeptidase 1-like isoform X1 [Linepithema humile]|uniref:endoplasmic reticulum aminopeptidase 1-like isoform X1 n=1 Tax=Linepithema humile TaxID=83485 RepID=UPI00351F3340
MNIIFRKLLTNGEIMLIATIAICTAINTENDTTGRYHLPDYIIPLHYNVNIKFDYKINYVIGKCSILIHITRETKNISMHLVTFAVIKIVLYDTHHSKKVYVPKYLFNNELNMFMIHFTKDPKFPKYLPAGIYTLILTYMRDIKNNEKHFYKSLYSNRKLDNKLLNATGVDVKTARQLFPCWDKRTFNATYKISIKHHKNYTAISNMPIQTTENDKHDMMWTHFEKSPSMSIQHLKVVIITSTNISTSVENVTFWSTRNVTNYLKFAICIAQQVLHFLKHENNIEKITKIDYIVLWDTQKDITEPWTLILQREADIHVEDLDSVGYKLKVARLITNHIVSLWYNDVLLWSKTGFATLLATYILYQISLD